MRVLPILVLFLATCLAGCNDSGRDRPPTPDDLGESSLVGTVLATYHGLDPVGDIKRISDEGKPYIDIHAVTLTEGTLGFHWRIDLAGAPDHADGKYSCSLVDETGKTILATHLFKGRPSPSELQFATSSSAIELWVFDIDRTATIQPQDAMASCIAILDGPSGDLASDRSDPIATRLSIEHAGVETATGPFSTRTRVAADPECDCIWMDAEGTVTRDQCAAADIQEAWMWQDQESWYVEVAFVNPLTEDLVVRVTYSRAEENQQATYEYTHATGAAVKRPDEPITSEADGTRVTLTIPLSMLDDRANDVLDAAVWSRTSPPSTGDVYRDIAGTRYRVEE